MAFTYVLISCVHKHYSISIVEMPTALFAICIPRATFQTLFVSSLELVQIFQYVLRLGQERQIFKLEAILIAHRISMVQQ